MKYYIHVCIALWTLHVARSLHGDDNDTDNALTPVETNPFDEALVASILKIVDVKFESISARMGSLERAMSSLQYYNLRQFRVVNTHMRALDTILQAANSQMSELDIANMETKNSIELLKKETKNMEKVQNAMFDAMNIHFEKLGQDMSKRFDTLEHSMEGLINSTNTNETDDTTDDNVNNMAPLIEGLTSVLNDSDRFSLDRLKSLEDKIDMYHNVTMSKLEGVEVEITNSTYNTTEERSLLDTLIDLNDNVLRSIDFYRHTGDLVERIVGATETVADDQDLIRADLRHFLEVQVNITKCTQKEEDEDAIQSEAINTNEVPNEIKIGRADIHTCEITLDDMQTMADIFRNSTHLTDLWTEMAQMNQLTLRSSVMDLMAEVGKLYEIHEKITTIPEQTTTSVPNPFSGLMENDLESIANSTKAVFQIVEAVASNTGWIPYIFHNLQFLEGQVNETIKASRKVMQKQENIHETIKSRATTEALTSRPEETRVINNDILNTINNLQIAETGNISYIDKLNTIYKTNLKIHRLIPSLTRFLAEPEPFITLVDGKNENDGRVEIFRNGVWGTLCKTIGHVEASYICRHLGYLGGISAGNGFYGAGSGVFWSLNMTCLLSRHCEIALPLESKLCNHEHDAGIICDHMLRLDTDDRKRRSAGYVSIHHRGKWLNICSDNWTSQNAEVACRQLGHSTGKTRKPRDETLTIDSGNLWLRNITCSGSETRLDACDNVVWTRGCESNKPVYISCK